MSRLVVVVELGLHVGQFSLVRVDRVPPGLDPRVRSELSGCGIAFWPAEAVDEVADFREKPLLSVVKNCLTALRLAVSRPVSLAVSRAKVAV